MVKKLDIQLTRGRTIFGYIQTRTNHQILKFVDVEPSDELILEIKKTTIDQKNYISKHKYDLKKFNLTEQKIKADCHFVYDTFLVK